MNICDDEMKIFDDIQTVELCEMSIIFKVFVSNNIPFKLSTKTNVVQVSTSHIW